MKTALLYNHRAGGGLPAQQTVEKLCAFFDGDELLVADAQLARTHLPVRSVQAEDGVQGYYPRIRAAVRALVDSGAERFVCVGGDGTATYLCSALYELGVSMPILGVAAGTANVGPVISVTLAQLEGRHISAAGETCCDGIAVLDGNSFLSLAFNDLVVGDTFLATVDGRAQNVSVRALLERGALVPAVPSGDVVSGAFCVELNGARIRPAMEHVRQIIVSSVARESHYGRAVYGAVGKCDWSEKKGVIALCDYIAVSYDEDGAGLDRFSAMNYLLFGPGDRVRLCDLGDRACLVCDGNPYLPPRGDVCLRYEPRLARIITL